MKAEINDILLDFQAMKICIGEASSRLEAYANERVTGEIHNIYEMMPFNDEVCRYCIKRLEELKQK